MDKAENRFYRTANEEPLETVRKQRKDMSMWSPRENDEFFGEPQEEDHNQKAKTSAQRQAEFSARQKKAGLVKVHGLWTHPDDMPTIKEFAAKLARKRAREIRRTSTNQETA